MPLNTSIATGEHPGRAGTVVPDVDCSREGVRRPGAVVSTSIITGRSAAVVPTSTRAGSAAVTIAVVPQ